MDRAAYAGAIQFSASVVAEEDIPDDLRVAAFSEVLRHALGFREHGSQVTISDDAPLVTQDTRFETVDTEYVENGF